MSLWDKWEREKLQKMGVEVERDSDIEIRDTHPRGNLRKQALIVAGALAACLLAGYIGMTLSGSSWSDWYIVRVFAERTAYRTQQAASEE